MCSIEFHIALLVLLIANLKRFVCKFKISQMGNRIRDPNDGIYDITVDQEEISTQLNIILFLM